MKLKQKYDREGIEFIKDEMELADGEGGESQQQQRNREKAATLHGSIKPGQSSTGELNIQRGSGINMGADNDNQKNPLSMIINAAKKTFNG